MTTKIIHVRPHVRKAPVDRLAPVRASMTENLLGFVTHRQCLEALQRAFSEPLDSIDMPEKTKTRMRETY